MPEVNLSALNGQDLRSLLDSARARGQAQLSYQILQEMAARREGRQGPEPHMVTLNLGDPLTARDDELGLEAQPAPAADEADEPPLYLASPRAETPPPESVWDDAPEAPPLKLQGLPHPGRPGFARAAVFAAGIALGAAGGWGAATMDLGRLAPAPAAEPPADFVRTANAALPATPEAQPAAPPAQVQVVEAAPPGEPVAAGFRETPLPAPEAAPAEETPQVAMAEAAPAAPVAPVAPEPPKITVIKRDEPSAACAAEPTPADRTICADPQLRRLQRELREAYGEALQAHEDRDTLRQRQLAWRDARNTVDDPARLAGLYEARIKKLHAATEAARDGR